MIIIMYDDAIKHDKCIIIRQIEVDFVQILGYHGYAEWKSSNCQSL